MKTEKIRYFLVWDDCFKVPYNKFITGVKPLGNNLYKANIKRHIFSFSDKIYIQEKQSCLLKETKKDEVSNIVYLVIVDERL
ncbi:MAG: hypothetical protein ACRCUM_01725 [Mycoplasmoidaceae bacterium]